VDGTAATRQYQCMALKHDAENAAVRQFIDRSDGDEAGRIGGTGSVHLSIL
jgi:hypothetical protein